MATDQINDSSTLAEIKERQELIDAQIELQRSLLRLDDPRMMTLPEPEPFNDSGGGWPPYVKAYILCALECGFTLMEVAFKLELTISDIYARLETDAGFRKMYTRSRKLQLETLKDSVLQNVKTIDADNYKHVRAQAEMMIKLIETMDLELAGAKGGKTVEIVFKNFATNQAVKA